MRKSDLTTLLYIKKVNIEIKLLTKLKNSILLAIEKLKLTYLATFMRYKKEQSLKNFINYTLNRKPALKVLDLSEAIKYFEKSEIMNELDCLFLQHSGLLRVFDKLVLSNCDLSYIPDSIGKLTNLKSLDLSRNRLLELPKTFGKLSNLEFLYLMDNKLTSLPQSMNTLSKLEYLNLAGNELESIPDVICSLNLETLVVSYNKISDIPQSIKNKKIENLHL